MGQRKNKCGPIRTQEMTKTRLFDELFIYNLSNNLISVISQVLIGLDFVCYGFSMLYQASRDSWLNSRHYLLNL